LGFEKTMKRRECETIMPPGIGAKG
jgi:hypothetical protein